MSDWVLSIVIVSFVIYKLANLTELDLGRGWLNLEFTPPRAKNPVRRKRVRN